MRARRSRCCEAAGYAVHLPRAPTARPLCCGRTFLAAGLVDEASAKRAACSTRCSRFVERGVPVVGLEPSCLLGLRDEFLSMLPARTRGARAATHSCSRNSSRASAAGPPQAAVQAAAAAAKCCCTAIATRKRSTRCRGAEGAAAGARPRGRSRSNRAAAAWPAASATRRSTTTCRCGWRELSLLPAVRDGRCRDADRRRRHELPPSDPRRRAREALHVARVLQARAGIKRA